jgi:hypothetical protein
MKTSKEGVVREIVSCSECLQPVPQTTPISASIMAKVSKHLALLTCMMILAQASGRADIGPLGIFILVVLAVLAHAAERTLRRRPLIRVPSPED